MPHTFVSSTSDYKPTQLDVTMVSENSGHFSYYSESTFGLKFNTPSAPTLTSNFSSISGVRPGAVPFVTSSGEPMDCMYSSMLFPNDGTSILDRKGWQQRLWKPYSLDPMSSIGNPTVFFNMGYIFRTKNDVSQRSFMIFEQWKRLKLLPCKKMRHEGLLTQGMSTRVRSNEEVRVESVHLPKQKCFLLPVIWDTLNIISCLFQVICEQVPDSAFLACADHDAFFVSLSADHILADSVATVTLEL